MGPFLTGLVLADPAVDPDDELMRRPPWAACEYCHGENGRIDSATLPAIAGQSASYIAKQWSDFRAGRRSSPGLIVSAQTTRQAAHSDPASRCG